MIRCTIVETTSTTDEAPTRTARATLSEILTFGRGAACKIYLPDPRVRLEHAHIERGEDGYLYLQGVGGPFQVDGTPQDKIRIALDQKIEIGPFEFVVSQIEHGLEVSQPLISLNFTRRTVPADAIVAMASTGGLRPSWLSVRTLSWAAVMLCALLLVAIPIWQAYQPVPIGTIAQDSRLDALWNPGPMSSAHKTVGDQCKSCHAKPFERVTDAACAQCHKNTGPHIVNHPKLEAEVFSGQRCATCHREHQGEDGMKKVDAQGCENCHAHVKTKAPSSQLPDVGDFARQHPDFRLTMNQPGSPSKTVRREQVPGLLENSGLKFSHDVHLSAKGVKSPSGPTATGGRVVLDCNDCHRLDSAKTRYQPISMERDCAECHRLGFDAQYPNRQVPHGSVKKVVESLHDMFSALALERNPPQVVTINSLLQSSQIQDTPPIARDARQWVDDKVRQATQDLLGKPKSTCKACHTVEPKPTVGADLASQWHIAPIASSNHWLPKSTFTHAQHTSAACSACHAAANSKSSADILIPPIQTCRDCHVGTDKRDVEFDRAKKVVSSCNSCHGFHAPVKHPSFFAAQGAHGKIAVESGRVKP